MAELKLEAQPRTTTGRKVRQLRQKGLVPVVVYGNKQEPVNLQVGARSLELTLQHGGTSQLVQVDVEGGGPLNVLIRDVQRHPVNHSFLHADFYAVNMSEKQVVTVPVYGIGTPEAMETGLMLFQALDMVEISALPSDIPANVEVDVTGVTLDEAITVADLPAIDGVEYLTESTENVFNLITTRVEEEEEEEEELEEGMEPELVGHERDEEEGEEEE